MEIQKSGWIKGVFLLVLAAGFLCAGIFANHYFRAKAAANEPTNHQKNQLSNQSRKDAEMINKVTKDYQLEKEWIERQQTKALIAFRKDKEIAKVPETKPAIVTTPVTNKPITSQTPAQSPTPAKPVQKPNQPANSAKRIVYLTFDDGPQVFSKDIIGLLQKYHFKATFFMIDGNIRRYPESVRLMVQMGEGVGLHSVTHSKDKFYASVNSVLGELNQNRNTLKAVSGVDSLLMRTPYGSVPYMTPEYKKAVWDHGYLMWDWNIDSKDWYYKDERYIHNVIQQITGRAKHNGPIVILLHERRETLAYLPELFDYLSKQNFDCKAIDVTVAPIHF
jgi:peptidoglycan/xylan/chitin deacetylase (PgdA/CDA1 family)